MAFNLRAILKLDDQFSSPMRKIERQLSRNQKAINSMSNATTSLNSQLSRSQRVARLAGDSLKTVGSMAKGASNGVLNLKSGLLGVAAAAGGAYSAIKIFENTVGEAMMFENSSIMIDAMFDDKKASKQYMNMMQKWAVESPLMNSQDIFGNSKSFIALTKNNKELKEMWSLAERLIAVDPMQGVEGAVFALREFFSGDIISLARRFELDKGKLKKLKDLDMKDQIKGLNKYFESMGMTQKLIDKMGGSTLGLWNQVKEQVQLVLRDMGKPALKVLSNFFDDLLNKFNSGEFNKFAEIGGNIIKSILSGLTDGAMSIYNWFSSIANSEEFQKQTTLYGKVKFVIEDIYQRFINWLDGGGREKIESTVSSLIQILAAGLDASIHVLTPIAVKIGGAIGQGMVDGFNSMINDSIIKAILGSPSDTVNYVKGKAIKWVGGKLWDKFGPKKGSGSNSSSSGPSAPSSPSFSNKPVPTSHASGLDRVPYDGYLARLHKDERILTPEESREYNNGGGSRAVQVSFAGAIFHVRQDSDIKAIAYELAKLIEAEGATT